MEYDSTIEAGADEPQTAPSAADVAPIGFEHRRLKEAVRQELFGHAKDTGRIGRFEIQRRLGAGGMGVVYLARDDELDRDVAIKLLRSDRRGEGAETRLRREAQAIAKLSHPNVVGVYEVGRHAGSLFVAMEFVRGQTLRQWLSASPTPEQIVDTYLQAASGLAAAHAAGLVHRDFKPDNVMLGEDGRVRVLDFGLAAAVGDTVERSATDGDLAADPRLTATGALLGTPSYMAPEQHLGHPADARSDQFAWCVSVWEALCADRPFIAEDSAGLLDAISRGPDEEAASGLTPGIRRALVRGLARDPDQRWPSMESVCEQLGPRPSRRRSALLALSVASVAVTAGIAWAGQDDCPDPREKLAKAWSPTRVEQARGAVAASPANVSLAQWQEIETQIDTFAAAWSGELTATCNPDVSDTERLETRLCLERLLDDFQALTDDIVAGRLEGLATAPAEPSTCGDTQLRRAQAREDSQRLSPAPAGAQAGLISDFETSMGTTFGAGWAVSTDQIVGGKSDGAMSRERGGADGSGFAMKISGTVDSRGRALWSGAMFFPGDTPMAPANLASKQAVSFAARGKPGTYVAMFFTTRTGFQPLIRSFEVTEEWGTVTLPTEAFTQELFDATAFFIGSGAVGPYELWVDDLRMD